MCTLSARRFVLFPQESSFAIIQVLSAYNCCSLSKTEAQEEVREKCWLAHKKEKSDNLVSIELTPAKLAY